MRLTRILLFAAVPVAAVGLLVFQLSGDGDDTRRTPTHGTPVAETRPPTAAVRSLPPVKMGTPAEIAGGVSVSIGKAAAFTATAHGPGEIAGSAVSVEVRVTNSASAPFDLNTLAVNAAYDGTPALPNDSDPAKPLSGTLRPGGSATGIYAFSLPREKISRLKVDVSSGQAENVAVFTR
jgi:hypothetical protein